MPRELENDAGAWRVERDYVYRDGAVLAAVAPTETTHPKLPTDLCFLRSESQAAVATTAHERIVSLALTVEDRQRSSPPSPPLAPAERQVGVAGGQVEVGLETSGEIAGQALGEEGVAVEEEGRCRLVLQPLRRQDGGDRRHLVAERLRVAEVEEGEGDVEGDAGCVDQASVVQGQGSCLLETPDGTAMGATDEIDPSLQDCQAVRDQRSIRETFQQVPILIDQSRRRLRLAHVAQQQTTGHLATEEEVGLHVAIHQGERLSKGGEGAFETATGPQRLRHQQESVTPALVVGEGRPVLGSLHQAIDGLTRTTLVPENRPFALPEESQGPPVVHPTGEGEGTVQGAPSRWTVPDLDGKVLRELKNDAGTWSVERDYVYRDGTVLAAVAPTETTHLHPDHLGSPRLITGSSGAYRAYHVYYPFGTEATSFAQDTERMKFTGHERDFANTTSTADDLDYMHARFYNMQIGRFLSFDPIGGNPRVPQSFNRYAYVMGNPLKYVDPYGLTAIHAGFGETITVKGRDPRWDAFTMWYEARTYFGSGPIQRNFHFDRRQELGMSVHQYAQYVTSQGGAGDCSDYTCQVMSFVADQALNGTEWLELGVSGIALTSVGGSGFSLFGRTSQISGYSLSGHAAKRMAERGITRSMVQNALTRGERMWDPTHGTVQFLLRGGVSSKDVLVSVNAAHLRITTVQVGKNVIRPRFLPLIQ